ncbi:ABZJ_00895 family protein [Acinetobacter larvae]|uniref:DUF4199 domain-containing protein n=1 Tax=Acinetobacter larvae TaxID=1789224 RepID=A0A1B2M1K4_9GAMM|nr:ABZJ_00895 family protein [Acinetobacter larvae]AOA59080.1 hypothetical protein BFG52_12450 [Acinetobacter larvae]
MRGLSIYFLWFFVFCLLFSLLGGMVISLLNPDLAMGLLAVPYLLAMIATLYVFLKKQRQAPTTQQRLLLSFGYIVIFWLYSAAGIVSTIYYFSRQDAQIWQEFLANIQNLQFLFFILVVALAVSLPLFFVTSWFYGPQAQRMAAQMFKQ